MKINKTNRVLIFDKFFTSVFVRISLLTIFIFFKLKKSLLIKSITPKQIINTNKRSIITLFILNFLLFFFIKSPQKYKYKSKILHLRLYFLHINLIFYSKLILKMNIFMLFRCIYKKRYKINHVYLDSLYIFLSKSILFL